MIQDKIFLDHIEKKEQTQQQKESHIREIENEKKATTSNKLAWVALIISALSLLVSIIQVL